MSRVRQEAKTRRGIAVEHFVEWHGAPVKSVKTAFNSAVRLAGLGPNALGKVTPHTLRHTAATWLIRPASICGKQRAS